MSDIVDVVEQVAEDRGGAAQARWQTEQHMRGQLRAVRLR